LWTPIPRLRGAILHAESQSSANYPQHATGNNVATLGGRQSALARVATAIAHDLLELRPKLLGGRRLVRCEYRGYVGWQWRRVLCLDYRLFGLPVSLSLQVLESIANVITLAPIRLALHALKTREESFDAPNQLLVRGWSHWRIVSLHVEPSVPFRTTPPGVVKPAALS